MGNRDQILTTIRDAGDWITSDTLCSELKISRMAVSKHVAILNGLGYIIETAPRRGYHFKSAPDKLLPEELRYHLYTGIFGQQDIHYFETTDSTNSRAKEEALNNCPEGTIFIAEKQTAGRGRRGRSWFSGNNNSVSLSIVLRPDFPPRDLTLIPLLTAVAVSEAIENVTGIRTHVKWPNDLLIEGRKTCGILTEAGFDLETIDYVVVGIGININTTQKQIPAELHNIATSLRIAAGDTFHRAALVREVLELFENKYNYAREQGFDTVLDQWRKRTCTLNHDVTIKQEKGDIQGHATDLTPDGGLLLRLPNGRTKEIISGDVIIKN